MGKCGCENTHCNNSCKPVCDPCSKQPKILYCGRPIDCLNIKKGDKLDDIIKVVGDKLCQIESGFDGLTYVNIEDATNLQCEYGGYVFQILSVSTNNLIEEAVVCNSTPLTFQENGVEISQALTVNFEDSATISTTANHNIPSNTTTYSFDLITTTNITWQEGVDLMNGSLVIPNMLYYVTDRGWYLEGITSTEFSIDGHKVERVVKAEYYTADLGVKRGVWNPSIMSASVGFIVVYGGKVWINTTGNLGSATDIFTLSNDWTVSNSNTYYENKILKIHIDYRNNWVFRQEDDKNNIISISKEDFSTFGLNRVWADWSMPNFYDNHVGLVLNNAANKSLTINSNRGVGDIIGNYGSIIRGNILKTRMGILSNSCSNIKENIVHDFLNNKGANYFNNILTDSCSGNTIVTNFSNNICKGEVTDNTLPFFEENTLEGSFTDNSNLAGNAGAGVKRCTILNDITNNILYLTGFEDCIFLDLVSGNQSIKISKSEVGISLNNSVLRVADSRVRSNLSSNVNVQVSNVEAFLLNNNTASTISQTKCYEINSNSNCTITSNNIAGLITNNTNTSNLVIQFNVCSGVTNNNEVSEIKGNVLYGSVSDNTKIIKISYNQINGDIKSNTTSSTPGVGTEIIGNTNNGSIFFNTLDNSVVINNNNNNGNIGVNASPTVRAVSILGTVVNL